MQTGVTLIGPVCHDTVRIAGMPERNQPGGTVYYAGMALRALDVPVHIITRLAAQDEPALLTPLRDAGATLTSLRSKQTTRFTNEYGPGTDERTQQVTAWADPCTIESVPHISTQWVYFAPLLESDVPVALIRHIAGSGAHRIALDAQGLLRRAVDGKVLPVNRPDIFEILPHVNILKADRDEAALLTGQHDPEMAARILCGRGVDHVLVTLGQGGAVLCHRGALLHQPAWRPEGQNWAIVDTTGCGDTFLAAYLSRILLRENMQAAGRFAAVAATVKQTTSGPLRTDKTQISRYSP